MKSPPRKGNPTATVVTKQGRGPMVVTVQSERNCDRISIGSADENSQGLTWDPSQFTLVPSIIKVPASNLMMYAVVKHAEMKVVEADFSSIPQGERSDSKQQLLLAIIQDLNLVPLSTWKGNRLTIFCAPLELWRELTGLKKLTSILKRGAGGLLSSKVGSLSVTVGGKRARKLRCIVVDEPESFDGETFVNGRIVVQIGKAPVDNRSFQVRVNGAIANVTRGEEYLAIQAVVKGKAKPMIWNDREIFNSQLGLAADCNDYDLYVSKSVCKGGLEAGDTFYIDVDDLLVANFLPRDIMRGRVPATYFQQEDVNRFLTGIYNEEGCSKVVENVSTIKGVLENLDASALLKLINVSGDQDSLTNKSNEDRTLQLLMKLLFAIPRFERKGRRSVVSGWNLPRSERSLLMLAPALKSLYFNGIVKGAIDGTHPIFGDIKTGIAYHASSPSFDALAEKHQRDGLSISLFTGDSCYLHHAIWMIAWKDKDGDIATVLFFYHPGHKTPYAALVFMHPCLSTLSVKAVRMVNEKGNLVDDRGLFKYFPGNTNETPFTPTEEVEVKEEEDDSMWAQTADLVCTKMIMAEALVGIYGAMSRKRAVFEMIYATMNAYNQCIRHGVSEVDAIKMLKSRASVLSSGSLPAIDVLIEDAIKWVSRVYRGLETPSFTKDKIQAIFGETSEESDFDNMNRKGRGKKKVYESTQVEGNGRVVYNKDDKLAKLINAMFTKTGTVEAEDLSGMNIQERAMEILYSLIDAAAEIPKALKTVNEARKSKGLADVSLEGKFPQLKAWELMSTISSEPFSSDAVMGDASVFSQTVLDTYLRVISDIPGAKLDMYPIKDASGQTEYGDDDRIVQGNMSDAVYWLTQMQHETRQLISRYMRVTASTDASWEEVDVLESYLDSKLDEWNQEISAETRLQLVEEIYSGIIDVIDGSPDGSIPPTEVGLGDIENPALRKFGYSVVHRQMRTEFAATASFVAPNATLSLYGEDDQNADLAEAKYWVALYMLLYSCRQVKGGGLKSGTVFWVSVDPKTAFSVAASFQKTLAEVYGKVSGYTAPPVDASLVFDGGSLQGEGGEIVEQGLNGIYGEDNPESDDVASDDDSTIQDNLTF